MPDVPPLRLIAATQERELFARQLEIYGDAVVTRMLPALHFGGEELLSMASIEYELPESDVPLDYHDASYESERDGVPNDPGWYARMEMETVRYYALGFAFVAVYHLFERQLATALGWLDYRHKNAILASRFKSALHFKEMKKILMEGEVTFDPHFNYELDWLRLITNVMKHSGRDLAKIARDHRDLLPGWQPGIQLTPDLLALTPHLFQSFVATLVNFWRTFPHEQRKRRQHRRV